MPCCSSPNANTYVMYLGAATVYPRPPKHAYRRRLFLFFSTLLPPAAAISSNKAAAAALRAQKHKHPTNVPSSAAAAQVKADHHTDAQPPNPASRPNTNPLSPATPLSQFAKNTGNTHQKAGSRTRPTPPHKGFRHKLKGGQLDQWYQSCAYPPVGDPVEHQAFLSAPSKRQARKAGQQGRAATASFGMPEDLHESGEPNTCTTRLNFPVISAAG